MAWQIGVDVGGTFTDLLALDPERSVFDSIADGADFDGIIAGDPGNNRTHLNAGFLWQFVRNHRPDLSLIIPPAKLAATPPVARAEKPCNSGTVVSPAVCASSFEK